MLRTKIQAFGGMVAWVVGQSSTDIRDLTGVQWLKRFCIPVFLSPYCCVKSLQYWSLSQKIAFGTAAI